MKLTRGGKSGQGSINKGAIKTMAGNAKRPPEVRGKVANDTWPNPVRSATMPPPQGNTSYKRTKAKF